MNRIYLSAPDVRASEREFLLAAFDSGWLAPVGPDLECFEGEMAKLADRSYAVGLSSGTAGLHLLLRELHVGPGDDVIVPTFTFIGSASPVTYCGATPFFLDSEVNTWNLSPDLLAEELADRRSAGRPMPKAVIVVDLYGLCADYDRISPLLEEYEVPLIEDAAEAVGATYGGRPAGSFGIGAVFSFNGNKLITTSGGGMVVTNVASLASQIRYIATQARQPAPHYEHTEIGYNARLSNLLAAVGRGQLRTLNDRIRRRRDIRRRYEDVLNNRPGICFQPDPLANVSNCWLTCITIDSVVTGFTTDQLRLHLEAANIEARPTWKPMHLQPVFVDAPRRVDGTSERIFSFGLCLPSGSGMTDADIDRVLNAIEDFVCKHG